MLHHIHLGDQQTSVEGGETASWHLTEGSLQLPCGKIHLKSALT